jgi:histidinol-phosphate aminotransferase
MQLPFGVGLTGLVAVAACYAAEDEMRQRIRIIDKERRRLRTQLSRLGIYSTDAQANFVYLPAPGGDRAVWRQVFDGDGPRVRHYGDGGVRITVGMRQSTRAVLSAVAASRAGG